MEALRGLVSAARARLAARPDTEHEQGIVRLIIATLLGAYLLPEGLDVFEWSALKPYHFVFMSYVVLAAGILAWNLASISISHVRRVIAVVADIATAAWSMW